MKFLICGIGSIGQRHFRNLIALGHEAAFFRSGSSNSYHQAFLDTFLNIEKEKEQNVRMFYRFADALSDFRPDAVIVANPNSEHVTMVLQSVRAGLHVFIEKPLSHSMEGISEIETVTVNKNLTVMVGYNLRFHPLLKKMKELSTSGEIGKIISARVDTGEHIKDWHPWEDYRKTYAPYKRSGGGVVLCFSHDIDYLYWFLGYPKKIVALGGKRTPLEGDAEDLIKGVLEFAGGVTASLHLDYWQRPPRRVFELVGSEGNLIWDYYAKTLTLLFQDPKKQTKTIDLPIDFDRNNMFIDEMKDFIDSIKNGSRPAVTLQDGINVLRIALDLKREINF